MLLHLNVGDQVATSFFRNLAKTATNLLFSLTKDLENFVVGKVMGKWEILMAADVAEFA